MITMLELMTTFHDIDRLKGHVCDSCDFYVPVAGMKNDEYQCLKGHKSAGPTDGCDAWQIRPEVDRETRQLAAVVMSV